MGFFNTVERDLRPIDTVERIADYAEVLAVTRKKTELAIALDFGSH